MAMTKASLIGHACWAAVAVTAFCLGASGDRGDPADQSGAAGVSAKSGSRLGGAADGSDEGRTRDAKGAAGRESERRAGPVAAMFPLPSMPRSEEELEALARQAFQDGNPLVRRMAFTRLLESLTPENAVGIREHLVEMGGDKEQWHDFHYAWGSVDGEAALKNAMNTRELDMEITMSGWASANPGAAEAFLKDPSNGAKTDNRLLMRGLIGGLADRDPSLAADLVFNLAGDGDKRAGELLGVVTRKMLHGQGPIEAARWSENLPDGSLKGAAMDHVAHVFVEKDPKAAAAWAEQFAGEDYAGRVIEEVGDEWAERNPAAAVQWLESLDEGGGQRSGLRSAFGRWAQRDPVAAGNHLVDMPQSEQRDAAISGFVRGYAYKDPRTAITWADSIGDDRLRQDTLTRAGRALFSRNPEAARTWVLESGLPVDSQQAILNPGK